MSVLLDLQDRVKAALKGGRKEEVRALRLLVAELQRGTKDLGRELGPEDELKILQRERKKRLEALEAYRAGRREDLATKEEYEAALIDALLPRRLNDQELSNLIDEVVAATGATSLRDVGRVMSEVMARGGAQVDGREASRLVKGRLSA